MGCALFYSRVLETMYEAGAPENQQKTEKQKSTTKPMKEENKPTFLHIHIKAILQGITIGASLLPSLKAQYKVFKLYCYGMTSKNFEINALSLLGKFE